VVRFHHLVLDVIEDDEEVARWFLCLIQSSSVEFLKQFTQDDVDQLENTGRDKSVMKLKTEAMTMMTPEAYRRAKEQEWGNRGASPGPPAREESDDDDDGISDDEFWTLTHEQGERTTAEFKTENAHRKSWQRTRLRHGVGLLRGDVEVEDSISIVDVRSFLAGKGHDLCRHEKKHQMMSPKAKSKYSVTGTRPDLSVLKGLVFNQQ